MNKLWAPWCCLFLLCTGALLSAQDQTPTLVVEPRGEGEFDFNPRTGMASATNGVIVRYGKAILMARQVTINEVTGEVLAEGNVEIDNDGQIWKGDRIVYNFKTHQLSTGQFRTGQIPFYIQGPGLEVSLTNRLYSTTNSIVTTDDYAEPLYTIRAKSVTIVPGRYIEAKNAVVYVGKVPVFYLPLVRRSLEHHPNFWTLTPGYRSIYGPYLLTAYHQVWSEDFQTALHMDYRQKLGPGVGPDATWKSPVLGDGSLRYYYTYDRDPGADPVTLQPIPENRQRLWFSDKLSLRTNLTVKAMVRYQSDPYVTHDFFEAEYRENVQPSTFIEANQDWPNWNLNLEVQPRVNDYQETIVQLPDVKLTGLRQELGESPFFYESVSSLGYYEHLFPDSSLGILYPQPYEAMRADTYHQVLVPLNLFGWLNIAPRAGQRFSYYSQATGPGATTDELGRAVFNTGMEISTKASRLWRNAQSSLLEVNGLRHVIEPSINYAFIPNPSPGPSQIPQFDSILPSYWLLPIDFPDYNDIDSIFAQNVMRFSLWNRLQTKRADGIENLVAWHVFADWYLQPTNHQGSLSQLYSTLEVKPRSWCTIGSVVRCNVQGGNLVENDNVLTLHPGSAFNLTFGYRYRQANEFGATDLGNNLVLSSLAYRFSESWGARATYQYNIQTGVMEEQAYTLYRDLRSWTAALTFRYRLNDIGNSPPDYGVAFTFSLKAFPRYGMGKDLDSPSVLLGNY